MNRHYLAKAVRVWRADDHEEKSVSVISSGAEGAVEKSLDVTGLAIHRHQDRSKLGSVD